MTIQDHKDAFLKRFACVEKLSLREIEVLELLGQGLSTMEIAMKLYRSNKTIESHLQHIREKTGWKHSAQIRVEAAIYYYGSALFGIVPVKATSNPTRLMAK